MIYLILAATMMAAPPVADRVQQAAEIVDTEFPSYDRDSSGALSSAEFGAWMTALKTIADPTSGADGRALKTWLGQAFARADADGSKAVSKAELNAFLAQGG